MGKKTQAQLDLVEAVRLEVDKDPIIAPSVLADRLNLRVQYVRKIMKRDLGM